MLPANLDWSLNMRSGLFIERNDRIVFEQCKLIIKNATNNFIASLFAFSVLFYLSLNSKNASILSVWFACTLLIIFYSNYLIQRTLKNGLRIEDARRLSFRIIASNFLFALHWLSYLWITLNNLTSFSTYLALTSNTALMALYLGTTTPIYLAYLVHAVTAQFGLSLILTTLGEPYSKNTWWFAGMVFGFFMYIAYKQNRATRKTIELQLEKEELLRVLEQQYEKVKQAQYIAEDANQAKSRFLAAASHDIRQPIHALGLFLNILQHGELTNSQERILGNAHSAFKASTEMLDTLLDFSRLESGAIQTNCRHFDLQSLLNKLEIEFAHQAMTKDLVYRMRETKNIIYSDPFLLELILRNLIGNAIRYTDQGGIFVGARKKAGQLSLEIWDTGIGIPSNEQSHIFREFYRLNHHRVEQRKGLGLGLAIAQGFARALGHEITFDSRYKHGSVFRLEIAISEQVEESTEQDGTYLEPLKLKGRVLIIEDDDAVRLGMENLIQIWGCECRTAINIEDALSSVESHPPDLIISDFSLREPGNGIEAIALLRDRLKRMVPAIIISGDTSPEQLITAQSNNIQYFSKPINTTQLQQALHKILNHETIVAD